MVSTARIHQMLKEQAIDRANHRGGRKTRIKRAIDHVAALPLGDQIREVAPNAPEERAEEGSVAEAKIEKQPASRRPALEYLSEGERETLHPLERSSGTSRGRCKQRLLLAEKLADHVAHERRFVGIVVVEAGAPHPGLPRHVRKSRSEYPPARKHTPGRVANGPPLGVGINYFRHRFRLSGIFDSIVEKKTDVKN